MIININLPEKNTTIDTELYIKAYNDNNKFIEYICYYINSKFKKFDSFNKAHSLTQLYGICSYLSIINSENSKTEDIEHALSILGGSIFVFFAPTRPETKNEYFEVVNNSKHLIDLLLDDGLLKPKYVKTIEMQIDDMATRYSSSILII